MEIEAKKYNRSYVLIAQFIDGFAQGWKMAVPEAFKPALDIKFTPRQKNKKTIKEWTQGLSYDFKAYDSFYDTKLAYTDWGEALKVLKIYIQLLEVEPSGYITTKSYRARIDEIQIIDHKKMKVIETLEEEYLTVNKQKMDYGKIKFQVYRPNDNRTEMVKCEVLECNQDDFVSFLQTGIVRTKKERIDLFDEKYFSSSQCSAVKKQEEKLCLA